MESRQRKPPINLNEVASTKENPEPGALHYASGEDDRPAGRRNERSKGGMNWGQAILSIIVSVVLSIIVVFVLVSPVKTDLANLAKSVNETNDTVAQVGSDVAGVNTKLDNITTWQGTVASRSDLSGYAKTTDIPRVDLTGYYTKAQVDAAIAAALAAKEKEAAASTEGITVEVKDYYEDYPIEIPEGTVGTPIVYSYEEEIAKLTLANVSGKDLEDVRLIVEIELDRSFPSSFELDSDSPILGGDLDWDLVRQSGDTMKFRSTRFDMDAGDTEKFYIVLLIDGTSTGTGRDIEISDLTSEVEDYSIVS
jgi:hypothetical protein